MRFCSFGCRDSLTRCPIYRPSWRFPLRFWPTPRATRLQHGRDLGGRPEIEGVPALELAALARRPGAYRSPLGVSTRIPRSPRGRDGFGAGALGCRWWETKAFCDESSTGDGRAIGAGM